MNGSAVALLAGAGVTAAVDWWAVAGDRRRIEYAAKPLTLALLIAVAVVIDPADRTQQAWFLVALSFSLAGDVALMLPRDRFVAGLAAFLLGHLAYVVGMVARGTDAGGLVAGAVVAVVAIALLGRRILAAAPAELVPAVSAYVLVISAMVATAIGTTEPWIITGALLFYGSDALIGWTRFVAEIRHGRVAVMITYHLGQAGLVLGLT